MYHPPALKLFYLSYFSFSMNFPNHFSKECVKILKIITFYSPLKQTTLTEIREAATQINNTMKNDKSQLHF
jgi:hypothetical protein